MSMSLSELHPLLLKKITQLTKVVFQLNFKNEQNSLVLKQKDLKYDKERRFLSSQIEELKSSLAMKESQNQKDLKICKEKLESAEDQVKKKTEEINSLRNDLVKSNCERIKLNEDLEVALTEKKSLNSKWAAQIGELQAKHRQEVEELVEEHEKRLEMRLEEEMQRHADHLKEVVETCKKEATLRESEIERKWKTEIARIVLEASDKENQLTCRIEELSQKSQETKLNLTKLLEESKNKSELREKELLGQISNLSSQVEELRSASQDEVNDLNKISKEKESEWSLKLKELHDQNCMLEKEKSNALELISSLKQQHFIELQDVSAKITNKMNQAEKDWIRKLKDFQESAESKEFEWKTVLNAVKGEAEQSQSQLREQMQSSKESAEIQINSLITQLKQERDRADLIEQEWLHKVCQMTKFAELREQELLQKLNQVVQTADQDDSEWLQKIEILQEQFETERQGWKQKEQELLNQAQFTETNAQVKIFELEKAHENVLMKSSEQIDSLNQRISRINNNWETKLRLLEDSATQENTELFREISQLKASFELARSDHEKSLQEMQAKHESEMSQCRSDHKYEVTQINEKHAENEKILLDRLKKASEEFKLAESNLNKRIQEILERSKLTETEIVANMQAKLHAKLSVMKSDHEFLIAEYNQRIDSLNLEILKQQESAVSRQHIFEQDVSSLKEGNEKDMNTLRVELEDTKLRYSSTRNALEESNSTLTALQSDFKDLTARFNSFRDESTKTQALKEAEIHRITVLHQEERSNMLASHEARIKQFEKLLDSKSTEIDLLQNEIQSLQERLDSMKTIHEQRESQLSESLSDQSAMYHDICRQFELFQIKSESLKMLAVEEHDKHISDLKADHLLQLDEITQKFHQIQTLFQERPPRQEDLTEIQNLRKSLLERNEELQVLNTKITQLKRDLLNKEQTYNKVFSTTLNVGIVNPTSKLNKK
jgi:hypothetical protein